MFLEGKHYIPVKTQIVEEDKLGGFLELLSKIF